MMLPERRLKINQGYFLFCKVSIVGMLLWFPAHMLLADGFTEEQKSRLLQALGEMSTSPQSAGMTVVEEHLSRPHLDAVAWVRLFEEYLAIAGFTVHHASHWESLLGQNRVDAGRVARVAASFAATAARLTWSEGTPAKGGFTVGLPFLERMFNNLSPVLHRAVADGIADAFLNNKVDLSLPLSASAPVPPLTRADAMQLCITLGAFAEPGEASQWLGLPDSTAAFLSRTGIWLFDGGTLSTQHARSLESIVASLPPELHSLVAVVTPDPLGMENPAALLRVPGAVLPISVVPMDVMRDIGSLPPFMPVPPVPDFTAMVMEQMMAWIQELHLPARPDLLHRSQVLVGYLGAHPATPLGALLPPGILQGTATDFFSYLGLLWMTHSEMLLEAAVAYLQQGDREPLYALLLLADLLSLRGDTTMLFRTDALGVMSSRETAIRRAYVGPASAHVNGIAIGGQLLQVEVADLATLLEMH